MTIDLVRKEAKEKTGTEVAQDTGFRTETQTKFQTKYLSVPETGSGVVMPELTFNLEIGKTYRINQNFKVNLDSLDNTAGVITYDGTTIIKRFTFSHTSGDKSIEQTSSYIVTPSDTGVITFVTNSFSTGTSISGTGDRNLGSWVEVEELPNHIETSEW